MLLSNQKLKEETRLTMNREGIIPYSLPFMYSHQAKSVRETSFVSEDALHMHFFLLVTRCLFSGTSGQLSVLPMPVILGSALNSGLGEPYFPKTFPLLLPFSFMTLSNCSSYCHDG